MVEICKENNTYDKIQKEKSDSFEDEIYNFFKENAPIKKLLG